MHHSGECLVSAEHENLACGKWRRCLSGKAGQEKGDLTNCPADGQRELEVGGSRSRSRIPKSLDCMSAVQRWHKQGSVNERETDFTTNSLAVVGGGGGTPAEQFSMDAITCRNERHTEKHRERRLHFLLTITGRT